MSESPTITMVHQGGTTKEVEYRGIGGDKARARIYWPTAGEYEVSPKTGRIVAAKGEKGNKLRRWSIEKTCLKRVRKDWRAFKKAKKEQGDAAPAV